MRLMRRIRESIKNDQFPSFVKKFIHNYYANQKTKADTVNNAEENKNQDNNEAASTNANKHNIPDWVINSLKEVNINVLED